MCPACFSSMAWLITGGVSALGGAAAGGVAIVRDRKIVTSTSSIWKLGTRKPLPSGFRSRAETDEESKKNRIETGETHG